MTNYRIKLVDRTGKEYKVSKSNMIISSEKEEMIFKSEGAAEIHARNLIDSGRARGMSAEIIQD